MSNTHTVAVYGTLKQGFGNHRLIQQDPIAIGKVSGHRLYQSGIPFLVEDATSEYDVQVEVYEVDDEKLQSLDWLEGHPSCYCRKQLQVETEDDTITAWVYQYPHPVGVENTTGIY